MGKNLVHLQSVGGSSLMVAEVLRMVHDRHLKCDISAHTTSVSLLKVAKKGNYLPYDSSWQFLLTSKLPKMATICRMTVVAKNGNFY